MSTMDLVTVVALTMAAFMLGRITYNPERWVEDKMKDIEKQMFDRLTNYFDHQLRMVAKNIEANIEAIKPFLEKPNFEVKQFKASSLEDMVRQVYREFKSKDLSEELIKKEIMRLLNIGEEQYERFIRDIK